jgi:peptidoglycan/xylan/chitin deacetylase (PgdA/CDA1 family)
MAAILLYHAVANDVLDHQLQVRPQTIRSHLGWCADFGYQVVPLMDALAYSAEKLVAVTFDDGLASFQLAWPELEGQGVRPTVFVCPGRLGGENEWASPGRVRERLLDTPAVQGLSQAGVSFGCHGWDHQPFEGRTIRDMEDELALCDEWFLRTFGSRPPVFAWPFGRFDEAAVRVVGRHHDHALAAGPNWDREVTRWTVPRIPATEGLSAPAFEEELDLGSFFLDPPAGRSRSMTLRDSGRARLRPSPLGNGLALPESSTVN